MAHVQHVTSLPPKAGETLLRDKFKFSQPSSFSSSPVSTVCKHCARASPARDYLASPWCARSSLLDEASGDRSSLTRGKLNQVVCAMAESGSTGPFYPVERVLSSRVNHGRQEYLLRWQGYGEEHDSWEPESHLLPGAREVLVEWERGHRHSSTPDGTGKARTPRKPMTRSSSSGPATSPTPPPTPPARSGPSKSTPSKQKKGASPGRSPGRPRKYPLPADANTSRLFFSDDKTDGVDASAGAVQHLARRRSEVRVPMARMLRDSVTSILRSPARAVQESSRPAQPSSAASTESLPLSSSLPPYVSVFSAAPCAGDFTDGSLDTENIPSMVDMRETAPDHASGVRRQLNEAASPSLLLKVGRSVVSVLLVAYLIAVFYGAFSVPSNGKSPFYTGG